jgi:hypothetical protein
MSSNVGLSTPRGSGTSGYVQRNLSLLKPRATGAGQPYPSPHASDTAPRVRKPDQQILQHDRLREIEVAVLARRDELEDEGKLDEEEIDEECERLREKLRGDMERGKGRGGRGDKKLKGYQVHELAEAKERESERLRRALGLKKGQGEGEDGEHPMARQERRKREVEEARDRGEATVKSEREREREDER